MSETQLEKIQNLFYNYPMRKFGVREFSKIVKANTKTVMKLLKVLKKYEIIKRVKKRNHYAYYEADKDSPIYYHEKQSILIKQIILSRLLDYIEKKTNTKAIVLFGSCSRGDYNGLSDIDLFIQANDKRLELAKYEKILNRKIHVLFEKNTKNLSKGLLTNIANGHTLKGKLQFGDEEKIRF